jgi:AcrR family transcriptional regulator
LALLGSDRRQLEDAAVAPIGAIAEDVLKSQASGAAPDGGGEAARRSLLSCGRSTGLVDSTINLYDGTNMLRKPASREKTRKPNMREAILAAAEELFSTNGFSAVSIRDVAQAAGASPGSVTYHFATKDGLLLEIYRRHCGPMNLRRAELLAAAKRVRDLQDRLEAIVRAYVLPAFSSGSDLAGGGARFTRLRAIMSAEGNDAARQIIAQTFDDTSHAFIDAIHESLPQIPRTEIVWRSHFLLGALYYTLVMPERISRLSRGEADGADAGNAIEQMVQATVASMQAPALDRSAPSRGRPALPARAQVDAAIGRR